MDRSDVSDAHMAFRRLDFPDLGVRVKACEKHGQYESRGKLFGKREIWVMCPGCAADDERSRLEGLAQIDAERKARARQEAIGAACIPLRFRELTFEGYLAETPQQRAMVSRVRDFAERFEEHRLRGTGLVLAGKPGTGKTHLAAAAMMSVMDSGAWVQYVTCMGLIRMVRDSWRKDCDRTEKQVLQLLGERIDLLVIDEVGVQYGTDSEQNILFEVLDRRYSEMRSTVLITNQDKAGFKAFIGERVADRLTQTHDWLVFDWPSYRKQARDA